MSKHLLALLREGHIEEVLDMVDYLEKKPKMKLVTV